MRWVFPHTFAVLLFTAKAAFMTLLCPLNSTAVSAHCTLWNTISAAPRFFPNTSEAKLELSLQGHALVAVIHRGAPHRAQLCVPRNPRNPSPGQSQSPGGFAIALLQLAQPPRSPSHGLPKPQLKTVAAAPGCLPLIYNPPPDQSTPTGRGDPPLPPRGMARCWDQAGRNGAALFPPRERAELCGRRVPPRARGRRSRSVYLLCTLR